MKKTIEVHKRVLAFHAIVLYVAAINPEVLASLVPNEWLPYAKAIVILAGLLTQALGLRNEDEESSGE